ncbi:MAG: iron complex transport system permease protein, partial [Polaribacter sp.]
MKHKSYKKQFIFLSVLLIALFALNISLGSVSIPFKDILNTLLGDTSAKESWQTIILNFRLPKA